MGEAAEDILCGNTCESCGEWFEDVLQGGQAPGYPRRCSRCKPAVRRARPAEGRAQAKTIPCPYCRRMFNSIDAMNYHRKAKEH